MASNARPVEEKPWHSHLTIDLLVTVAQYTFLHPFVAWMIPLSLRAQLTPYTHTSFRLSVVYAASLTVFYFLSLLSQRIAHGAPRKVIHSEEVIVITGGASGLGLLLAQIYGMQGATVAILDVKRPREGEIKGVTWYECNVGDKSQVASAAQRISEDLGTPTILINNAGIVNGKSFLELTTRDIERNFHVNLLSHFHTIQTFLPGMLEEGRGTIVTVASVLGYLGSAYLSDYTSAKAGLIAMHTSLEAELQQSTNSAAKQIQMILCTPGQLNTALFAGLKTPSAFLAPLVEPVDIAKAISKMIDSGDGGHIALPFYAGWIQWLNVLPAGLQKIIRSLSGVDSAMAHLEKKK
ncbi:NAD(P)-binding protein [Aulographum hederae CBS 113979]|uniref:NAD(P)-binding protein n=1 Tax=Aulographum hederae CBS 113979 TaxID=1176131 RepID=A0A6G1H977_9PEZI|nr:NAD(P)-binding protein [Aulographum hederae CBS 113979]